jgi:hypothetical protein
MTDLLTMNSYDRFTYYICHIGLLWIHHWVLLQFVLPTLTVVVEDDLEAKYPDGTLQFPFKHGNWEYFISHMDKGLQSNYYKRHDKYPKFESIWLGKRVMPKF